MTALARLIAWQAEAPYRSISIEHWTDVQREQRLPRAYVNAKEVNEHNDWTGYGQAWAETIEEAARLALVDFGNDCVRRNSRHGLLGEIRYCREELSNDPSDEQRAEYTRRLAAAEAKLAALNSVQGCLEVTP